MLTSSSIRVTSIKSEAFLLIILLFISINIVCQTETRRNQQQTLIVTNEYKSLYNKVHLPGEKEKLKSCPFYERSLVWAAAAQWNIIGVSEINNSWV